MNNNIVDLLVELTRNVDEPITRIELAKRYNEKFNTELPFQKFINNQTLFTKISTANVSRMRRAKMLYLLKVPLVDPIFKSKLEEIAILDFDEKDCLTKFTLKADGSVIFSLPKKSQYVRSVERFSLDYSKRATSPIPRNPLFKKFLENGGNESEGLFIKTFDKVCKNVLDSDRSLERKVKFSFVHGLVISGDLLKEFRTIGRVYVNRKNQITGFKSFNGELNFSGKPKKPRISQRIENKHVERPEEEEVPMNQDQDAPKAQTSSVAVKTSEDSSRSPVISTPKLKKAPEVVVTAPSSSKASRSLKVSTPTPEAARTPNVFTPEVMDTPESRSSQKRPIEQNLDIEPAAKKMAPPKHPFRFAPRPVREPQNLPELDVMKIVPESMGLPIRAPQKTTHEDLPMATHGAALPRTTHQVLAQTTYRDPAGTTHEDRLEALKLKYICEALLQATYKAPPMAMHDVPALTTHDVFLMVPDEATPAATYEEVAQTTHEALDETTHEVPAKTTHEALDETVHEVPAQTTHEVYSTIPDEAIPATTHEVPVQTTHEALVETTHEVPAKTTHEALDETTHEVPAKTTHEGLQEATHKVSARTTHEVPVQTNQESELRTTHEAIVETTHEALAQTIREAVTETTHEVSDPMSTARASEAPEAPPRVPNMLKAIKQEPLDDDVLIWTAKKPKIQIKQEPKESEEEMYYDPIPYNPNIVREEAPDAPEVPPTLAPLAHKVLEDFFRILSAQLQREHPQRFNGLIQKWAELKEVLEKSQTPLTPTELVHAFQTMIEKKLKPVKVFEEGVGAPKFLKELMDNTQKFYVLNAESKDEKLMWKEMRRTMKKKLETVTRYEVFTYDAIITCFSKLIEMLGYMC